MKKLTAPQLCFIALAAVINLVGGNIALALKLPVYLDSIGTILVAALAGPLCGVIPGIISGVISGMTTDIYAFYFIPVQVITGVMAGLLFRTPLMEKRRVPVGVFCISIPGTLVAAGITAYVFGGITSSGSSIFVALFHKMGMGLVASAFSVQVLTDYADRLLSVGLVMAVLSVMSGKMKMQMKRGK